MLKILNFTRQACPVQVDTICSFPCPECDFKFLSDCHVFSGVFSY